MSRLNLSLVFEQPSATKLNPLAKDLNGWTVENWFDDGFMGWDPETCTYFLHLETSVHPDSDPEGADVLAWQFGRNPGDLVTPFEVQAILGALFNVNGFETFAFKDSITLVLLGERDRMFSGQEDRPALAALRRRDEEHVLGRGTKRPPAEWIAAHAKMGVKADERFEEPTA
ncbi:hypothetical protein MJ547_04160, partial [Burkholderia gladioli]